VASVGDAPASVPPAEGADIGEVPGTLFNLSQEKVCEPPREPSGLIAVVVKSTCR